MTTSSTNCAPSTWRRLASVTLLFAAAAAHAATPTDTVRSGEVEQAWFRLTQTLDPYDGPALRARCDELVALAHKADLRRLTPFALALMARARTLEDGEATTLLECATALDPGSPETHLALASVRLRSLALPEGGQSVVRGARALVSDGRLAHVLQGSAIIALLCVLLAGFVIWALVAARRVLASLWHDLMEMAGSWRLGPNGVVVAVVALALPLFAGGDVVWLLLWLFALCWAYFSPSERVLAGGGLLLVAAAPTLLEVGFRSVTRNPGGVYQAAISLAEKRYDPQVLEELDNLTDLFGESPEYYRLQGDLYRQFGLFDGAAWAYREGLRRSPNDGALSLALGTVRYLEGDYNAALQAFQIARASGADPVVVNYNLSLTFAETYHFRESDEAMARAREADETRLRRLTQGRDHEPILPSFSRQDADALVSGRDPISLLHRGLVLPPLLQERTIAHPLTLSALTAIMFAIGHFLLRDRTTGFATTCLKCGRPFCRRCRLSQERQSYCAQCVNIFLKKDMVGIDAQVIKRRQVARHQLAMRLERRLGDLFFPGLGLAISGRPVAGALIGAGALTCTAAALVWLPLFVAPALMSVPVWPLQAAAGAVWVLLELTAQVIPAVGR